jgi:hypothetical protein
LIGIEKPTKDSSRISEKDNNSFIFFRKRIVTIISSTPPKVMLIAESKIGETCIIDRVVKYSITMDSMEIVTA